MKKFFIAVLVFSAAALAILLNGCNYFGIKNSDTASNGSSNIVSISDKAGNQTDMEPEKIYRESAVLNAEDNYRLIYRNGYGSYNASVQNSAVIVDGISKNMHDVYSIENSVLKKLDKQIEIKTCKTDFTYSGDKYDLKFDWYELDGQAYIAQLYPTADKINIGIDFVIGQNALVHADKHFYLCSVKTGHVDDTFKEVYKYLSDLYSGTYINKVVPSDDGKSYILLCGNTEKPSLRVIYYDGKEIVDISSKANMRHNISADAYFTEGKITVLYKFSAVKSSDTGYIDNDEEKTSYIFYIFNIASGELTRTAAELAASDIIPNGRYVYYTENTSHCILDLFTGNTVKADLSDMELYSLSGLDGKYFYAYSAGEALLLDASTGKKLAYIKNKTDCLLSMHGAVITGTDGKRYLAVYDPADNIHIYRFDTDIADPEAAYEAGFIQNDDFKYKLIFKHNPQSCINIVPTIDNILYDDELYTVDYDGISAQLKPLGIKCGSQICTASFVNDGVAQRVTFEWYKIDGKIYIGDYEVVSQNNTTYIVPLDSDRVIIHQLGDSLDICRVCYVETGEVTDTFADVSEYLSKNPIYNSIHSVIPSSNGKNYIILCGESSTSYDTIALYYDGKRITDLAKVCGVRNFTEVKACFEADQIVLNFTCQTRPTDVFYNNRVITDYLYTFDTVSSTAKKVCDEIINEKVFFSGRYVTVYKPDENNLTYIIDMLTGSKVKIITGDAVLSCTDIAGDYLFFGYADSESKLIDPSSGEAVYKIKTNFESCINREALYIAQDGKMYMLCTDGDGNIHILKFAEA